ncbi:hypothetical protein OG884_18840 [Streptosporangium sp. NBC_01755]|uniref:phage tail tube protein n=1 Tax=Streptosporangium sp. NBC_01755 TaxID=2975949 RepID=UPI002DD97FA0|nr:hypothetical protein [Streptosporangium sp. NBC_01755]WSD03866.1 hypothetical protein OG884_18840 [Streptosporangium sp. NBC_01755]
MKRLSDGNTKATFAPAVASLSAPTVAELTAVGIVACEEHITADGLNIGIEQGAVTGDTLASTQTFEGPGRTKAGIELTFFRDTETSGDRMWSVMTNGTQGYFVVRRGVAYDTPYAAGQKIAIYTVTCGEPSELAPEAEAYDKATVKLFPSGRYLREATVAA